MSLTDTITKQPKWPNPTVGEFIFDPKEGALVYTVRELTINVPPPFTGFRKFYEEFIDFIIGYGH